MASPADLPALMQIEHESFAQPHWRAEDFRGVDCTVAELDGQVAGFLVARQTFAGDHAAPSEREILNIAVARRFRRMGIASALLSQALGSDVVHFLEVRESNLAAQALYRKFGFVEIGRRHGYYQSPGETAIVMQMK